jgi:hypothetical protein
MGVMLKHTSTFTWMEDGCRVLVEWLWPGGLSRKRANGDLWLKDAGTSTEFRRWIGFDPDSWEEFRRPYLDETWAGRPIPTRYRRTGGTDAGGAEAVCCRVHPGLGPVPSGRSR